jgi:hypothetical protein
VLGAVAEEFLGHGALRERPDLTKIACIEAIISIQSI